MNNKFNNNQNQIFEREMIVHLDSLYNFSMSLTKNPDEANDLVQETYYKAYKFFDRYKNDTNSKAWLCKILYNTFINGFRRKARRPDMIKYDTVEPFVYQLQNDESAQSFNQEEKNLIDEFLSDEVTDALNKLPNEFKTTVMLSDLEEMSYKEIAEIMDCPVGTIRSRLSRSRKMLQKTLSGYAKTNGIIPNN